MSKTLWRFAIVFWCERRESKDGGSIQAKRSGGLSPSPGRKFLVNYDSLIGEGIIYLET